MQDFVHRFVRVFFSLISHTAWQWNVMCQQYCHVVIAFKIQQLSPMIQLPLSKPLWHHMLATATGMAPYANKWQLVWYYMLENGNYSVVPYASKQQLVWCHMPASESLCTCLLLYCLREENAAPPQPPNHFVKLENPLPIYSTGK